MSVLNQESLAGLDFKVLAIQRTEAGRWWNFKNVISPFSRLWLILGGRAAVHHHGRRFVLEPGCLHLVPPFTPHDCSCSRRLDHYHLHFVSRLPTGVDLFSLLDCEFQLPAPAETQNYLQRLEVLHPDRKLPCFDPAREEYRSFPVAAGRGSHDLSMSDWFETNGLLTMMLTPFLQTAQVHEGIHARVTRQFLAVQEFIHQHIREPILLGDLARAANLHPTYFSDRFQKLVGVRPLEYLMRYRLERAQFLLLTSRAPIKQVAYEVGIPDPAYFTRAFTRFWRVSPTRYRADHSR
jgi:AraC-like DNA-binding protein